MDRSDAEPSAAAAGGAPDVLESAARSSQEQPKQADSGADSDLEFPAAGGSGSEWEAQSGDSGGEWGHLPDPHNSEQLADFLAGDPEPEELEALHQMMAENDLEDVLHDALVANVMAGGQPGLQDLPDLAEELLEDLEDEEVASTQYTSEEEDDISNPDLPPEDSFRPPGWADEHGDASGWAAGSFPWEEVVSGTSHSQAADALCAWRSPAGDWELAVVRPRCLQLWHRQVWGMELVGQLGFDAFPLSTARSPDGAAIAIGGDDGVVLIATYSPERPAARRLRPAAALLLGPPQGPDDKNMVNGLRFATLCGKACLLAAAQDGCLYVLANPHTPESLLRVEPVPVGRYLLSHLPASPAEQRRGEGAETCESMPDLVMLPVYGRTFVAHSDSGALDVADSTSDTHSIALVSGHSAPLNQAVPSPCGRWVAVALDRREVWVLDAAAGLRRAHTLRVQRACGPLWAAPVGLETGAQYLAWSPDSCYLAACFDKLHCARVWRAPGFQPLLSLECTKWPPLALAFSPGRPSLLAVAARREHVYLLDVAAEAAARGPDHQGGGARVVPATLQCMSSLDPARKHCPRTDGLALTDTSLLLATAVRAHPSVGVSGRGRGQVGVLAELRRVLATAEQPHAASPRALLGELPVARLGPQAGSLRPSGIAGKALSGGLTCAAPPALQKGLLNYNLLPLWSLDSHRLYPERFRAAARALLMCACKGQPAAEGAASVGDLPGTAVLKVIAGLAADYPAYFPPCGRLPALTLH